MQITCDRGCTKRKSEAPNPSQLTFTSSNSTIEKLEKVVKYDQS